MSLERASIEPQQQGMSFADFIRTVAAKAGLSVDVRSPDMVICPFEMGEGRHQNVFIRPMGTTNAGNHIVSFFSPCLKLAANQQLGQKAANDLLKKSAKLAHGAWCIDTVGGEDYLGVIETGIAQTMQPEEFQAACRSISWVADEMEKQLGADAF